MAERHEVNNEGVTYRYKRSLRRLGLWGMWFFIVVLVGTVSVALLNPDGSFPNPVGFAIVFGVFWSSWVGLSFWLIRACKVTALTLGEEAIDYVGIKNQYHIPLKKISSLKWRTWPNRTGSVVVRTREVKLAIDFANYEDIAQNALVKYFREKVSKNVQEGWDTFQEKYFKFKGLSYENEGLSALDEKEDVEVDDEPGQHSVYKLCLKYGSGGLGVWLILLGAHHQRRIKDMVENGGTGELIDFMWSSLLALVGFIFVICCLRIQTRVRDDD